jgi:hypothetical protein
LLSGSGWASYKARDPIRTAYYSSAGWRRRRREQLEAHPLCRCGAPATEVDHVLAVALGGDLRHGALQSMCAKHHHEKTVRDSHEGAKRAARGRRRPQ